MSILNLVRHGGQGRRQQGVSLVELVIFIVIISTAVVGILGVMSYTTSHSADPLVRKQALAVATALLEEIQLMPFTTCDPDYYDAATNVCQRAEAIGPESGETRNGPTFFDNVNDYHGFTLTGGGADLGNSGTVVVPAGYSASVVVTPDAAFGPSSALLPSAAVLRIAVSVTYAGGVIVAEGYRTQYAPIGNP